MEAERQLTKWLTSQRDGRFRGPWKFRLTGKPSSGGGYVNVLEETLVVAAPEQVPELIQQCRQSATDRLGSDLAGVRMRLRCHRRGCSVHHQPFELRPVPAGYPGSGGKFEVLGNPPVIEKSA